MAEGDAALSKRVYGELGSLYQQCGGVFGVSGFVDKCMDKWMADDLLNANGAVARWHESAQRPGFKFLVVQIVCQLTGGPHRYTGRPIDEAHKHLNISPAEWDTFMELFNEVCDELNLPGEMIGDLNALMISMEDDCVTQPGDRVPPNPGPRVPSGNSLYAKLGGVYPIALFVDRLVDGLLADDRVHIPQDEKRNEASLKYLFTETICSLCGGPEVRTAADHNETKLLIPKLEWPILAASMRGAADHLPAALIPQLEQTVQRSRDQIVDPASPSEGAIADVRAAQVKTLAEAAAGEHLAAAANARRLQGAGASLAARRRVFGDPRTLYGRGGGVFGLAKFTDRLMDVWMDNGTLNANEMVARWHQSQQKCGFKFLVTQLMGYLTGGPQRYTGQSMMAAHKHLGITPAQWQSFVADAQRVFEEFRLESSTSRELLAIISGMQEQCIVRPGEAVPADPGLCRRRPAGSSTYAHLGGVYPISQYVDRIVTAVLAGDRVQVKWDTVESGGARVPAALKYIVTELLCNATGGPELITAKDYEEAKLGVEEAQWDAFLAIAEEAAQLWPTARARELILNVIRERKADICVGLVDESGVSAARRELAGAGFGIIEQAAALDHCGGDAAAALALLRSGWSPESLMRRSGSGSSLASLDTDFTGPAGPAGSGSSSSLASMDTAFSGPAGPAGPSPGPALQPPLAASDPGSRGSSPQPGPTPGPARPGGCPFLAGMAVKRPAPGRDPEEEQLHTTIQVLSECGNEKPAICELLGVSAGVVEEALTHDRYAMAAKFLSKKRKPLARIAEVLKMTEARVHNAIFGGRGTGAAMAGRVLDNEMQVRLDTLNDEDSELCCPVSLMLFVDPVIASDGFMYEADSVKALIRNRQVSPITREVLKKEYFPAKQKKSEVMSFREKRSEELLQFASDARPIEARMADAALDRVLEYMEVMKPAQHPNIARKAAALWQQSSRAVPAVLRPHLGMAEVD